MSDHRIGLGHDLAVELDDRYVAGGVQAAALYEVGLDFFRIFVERVADVVIGNVGVYEKQTDDLSHGLSRRSRSNGCWIRHQSSC